MSVEQMVTERLLLVPFTYEVASSLLEGRYDVVLHKGFFLGEGWHNRTFIGDTGFKGRPNADGEVDIGYAIMEKERKQGYGVEAAKGLAKWALSEPDVSRM
ncbi:GNAT family N-acetyltransferase [Paenibacillus sp. FJAT-27812]|uniref:GNAT family N-acetyltransferase n=1 Tax=Paenibacillus sp. FJAT-27812 TaxID=1684143 RepID=UPI000ACAA1D4|nr:GNAT family N-acetyltransferase [Paenibacillus sp. FJAT-27812]